ncbi:MAG: hypothetical protein U0802_11610 [Candidatus Binatia bacterium]
MRATEAGRKAGRGLLVLTVASRPRHRRGRGAVQGRRRTPRPRPTICALLTSASPWPP